MPKKIIATGADRTLFHVAARELGDPGEWVRIAQASGVSDPMILGAIVLTIPDRSPKPSDGIPPT